MRKGFFARLALTNIRKNRKVYYPYLLTAIITTAMLYIICSLSSNPSLGSDTLMFSLQLGVFVTSVFSVVFLFYTNSFLMKRRKREFGLFNILGMEKKHIGRVVGWETLFILLLSLLGGFGFGILLDRLMYMLLSRMLGDIALPTFYVSSQAMVLTLTITGATFALIFLNSLRQIHTSKPIELLRGGEVGEREPKARWLLALLGVVTLGAGYCLSLTVKNAAASIFLFFVAVLLVIAGTYLLFTAGSVAVLKLLKRNKRFYYRTDHFISLSGMIYRMKRNAIGLANICILSTMVLVMVFSTVALWMGMGDMIDARVSGDISVQTKDYERTDELNALTDDQLAAAGLEKSNVISYTFLEFAGYKTGDTYLTEPTATAEIFGDGITSLLAMPLEEYNRAFGESETLQDGEILLASIKGEHPEDTLSVFDMDFRVKKRVAPALSNGSIFASIYNMQFFVVNSWQTFDVLYEKECAAYGKHASSISHLLSFDLNGTDEQQLAFYGALRAALSASGIPTSFVDSRVKLADELMELYGGLLFVGLFLSALFIMAMILIMYYKQISEGYDDNDRYRIMRKVGLSRSEIKRSINSQIMTVFFLPLLVAGVHIACAFPCLTVMFSALHMLNVPLMVVCALASFAAFALMYGLVYLLTAKVYYRIVSD